MSGRPFADLLSPVAERADERGNTRSPDAGEGVGGSAGDERVRVGEGRGEGFDRRGAGIPERGRGALPDGAVGVGERGDESRDVPVRRDLCDERRGRESREEREDGERFSG